jgi:hypothetical protein
MRLTDAQAKALGIVIDGGRARVTKPSPATPRKSADLQAEARAQLAKAASPGKGRDPQQMIFDALALQHPDIERVWEAEGLVPGRRFRGDIYLPGSRVVVEMDGFAYHRSKEAFQKDRERQNLLVQHGYRVLRYYTRQVFNDLDAVVAQIADTHYAYAKLVTP